MFNDFRGCRAGVSTRLLGTAILIALHFAVGCASPGNSEAQLAVATLSGGLPTGSVSVGGGSYPATALKASGGTPPYLWAVTSGSSLPAGLTLSSGGTISGSPTKAGAFNFSVTVTDSAAPTHTAAGSLTITINPQLAVNASGTTLADTGVVGSAFPSPSSPAASLMVKGGSGTLATCAISSGVLPTGLSPAIVSGDCDITGSILSSVTAGTFTFTVKVTDSQGDSVTSGTITLTVNAGVQIATPTLPLPNGAAGANYPTTETFTASGGSGTGYKWTLASGSLPTGLSLSAATGARTSVTAGPPTVVGSYPFTLKATDSQGYTATTGPLNITVTSGPAAKLVFTGQPTNVAARSSIAPAVAVTVEDTLGNTVTTANNLVTIAIAANPSSGALSGTLAVAAVNGVASFSNLSINKTGIGYTLSASATNLTSATSSAFNVTAGTASKLVFSAQPTNVSAGASITPAVTVSIEDALGNLVTTATNPITIAIGTNPAGGTLSGTAVTTASGGIATFSNLSIDKVGTGYTLTATATNLTGATSSAFNVSAGAAAKLAFTVQPTSVTAGSSISPAVTVSVEDSIGNIVTAATNQITIGIGTNRSSGTLSGTAVALASGGVATFANLSINNAGSGYTLTGSATGLIGAISTAFNVNAGAASKLVLTTQPGNVTAGSAITPAVAVSIEDALGNLVTTATNQVTIAIGSNPSAGTISGTAAANASAGIATFPSLSINNVGTGYTLSASATGFTIVTSIPFNVTVGAAAKLAFSVQPGSVTAGNSISPAVTVSVEDSQGNLVATATNAVTMSIATNPSNGTLGGTLGVAAINGVATFPNLSVNSAGVGYALKANATNLTAATSTNFNVTAGATSKIAFSVQPSNLLPGSSISPAVAVSIEDALGNVVTTATNQITVAIGTNPSAGTLSGTLSVTAVNGVATFPNLSINNTGLGYTLTASATGFTTITSSPFSNIVFGVPAKLAFTQQPSNVTAGSAISPSITVTVEDAANNPVNSATNSITIAIGTNPASGTLGGTLTAAAVNGVATFSTLNINKTGTGYTLTASATNLTGATSIGFNVTAGAAKALLFTVQPTNVAAGSFISPSVTVSINDALGNLVTTATNPITIAIGTNPAGGTLGGTVTIAAINGVATFSTLSVNKVGANYTLTAGAPGLTGSTSIAFNITAGSAMKLAFTVQPTNVAAGSSISPAVTVSVEDSQGNVVPAAVNLITMAIGTNPSSGTLGGTLSVAAVNGVAIFSNLNINNAGLGYTLAASTPSLTSATSATLSVTAGAATKLVFTVQPASVTAGNVISPAVTVSVEDALNNVVTTATNQITVIGSSGTFGGTLSVAAVNGVASFSTLSVNNAGTGYTLTANATGFTSITSSAFNVTVGTASKLVFAVQPTSSVAGSTISPTVTVNAEDAAGNLVPTATNSITIAIGTNPASGTLGGTLTAAAVNGVATFSTLNINNPGTGYTLAAGATGLSGATSTAFNITVGAASKLAFTVQPSSVAVGASISPAITVSVEDSLGNIVTSANNSITMAIGTNPSSGTLSGTLTVAAVNGVATFSNLSINNVGTGYTLTANATGFTAVISNALNVAATCTNNCTLSGTVTLNGQPFANLTITLTGPTNTSAATNASGVYNITGLTAGQYTVTAPAGYTYNPATPLILAVNSNTVQNFTATSTVTAYSISGTISYAGSNTGNTIIRVFPANCTGCSVVAGTSFTSAPTSGGTAYTIRGLAPAGGGQNGNGSYVVSAQIDTLGNGIANESNPEGSSSTVTITSSNLLGVNLTVVDRTPSAPVTPTKVNVAPGNTVAVVQYKDPQDNNGEEIATSYNVYYGTDSNASNGAGSPKNFIAQGQGTDIFILKGLANGLTYFKVTAVNGKGESAATTPLSVTLAGGTGANTVSGTVTFPGSATGHTLYVGVYGSGIYFQAITNPVSPQAYSIAGVPSGVYQNFAIIDMNDDGEVGAGDIDNVNSQINLPTLNVSGSTTGNVVLTNPVSTINVPTSVQGSSSQSNSYNISVNVSSGSKLPISMTLFSGKNVAVPFDMNADQHNANYNPIYTNSVSPTAGDAYQFLVTFSDGTTQVLTGSVTAVLTSFAQNLAMNSPVSNTATVPVLNWTAPATLPTILPYSYSVNLYNTNSTPQENWNYYGSGSGNGIPSTQTNVQFDVDGSANPNSSLTAGGTYNWSVTVQDNANNSAQYTTSYIVPGGATQSPVVTVSFNPTAISVGGNATLVFNINDPNGATALTNIAFSDTLTNGLTVLGTTPSNTCGGSLLGTGASSTSISVSGVSLAASGSCQIGIQVTSSTLGTANNQTGVVTSSAGTGTNSNTASLAVGGSGTLPPTINISFNPSPIHVNFSTTLSFGINNPNSGSSLSGINFTDNLPPNLFVLSPNNGQSGSCGSGTITAVAGSSTISLSGGTLPASGNCSFSVNVTATASGTIDDATGSITSNEGGTGGTSNTASLSVNSGTAATCAGAPSGKESVLSGRWVVMLQGWQGTNFGSPAATLLSLSANGAGSFNDVTGTGVTGDMDANYGANGANSVFTSTVLTTGSSYQVGLDPTNGTGYLGCMTLANSGTSQVSPGSTVLRFALSVPGGTNAVHGRIIGWTDNSGNGSGLRGAGLMLPQDATAFSGGTLANLKPNYAFGEDGLNTAGGHIAIAGTFSLNTGTGQATSSYDYDDSGTVLANQMESPTITNLSATTGRALLTGTPQGQLTVSHSAIYIVNANELFLLGIDPYSSSAMFSGKAVVTGTTFSNTSVAGNYLLYLTSGGGIADMGIGVLSLSNGTVNSTSTFYSYEAGSPIATVNPSGTYSVSGSGRMTLSGSNAPVIYLATPQSNTESITGFVVGGDHSASAGELEPGANSNVSVSTMVGNYIFGNINPGDSTVNDETGAAKIDSSGNVTGYSFTSGISGLGEGDLSGGGSPPLLTITNSPLPGFGNIGSGTVSITNGTRIWFIDAGGSNNSPASIHVVEP